jgi:hypothetical protein
VLPALDRAYLRPTADGFADFQGRAASVIHDFLRAGGESVDATLDTLDRLYEESRVPLGRDR